MSRSNWLFLYIAFELHLVDDVSFELHTGYAIDQWENHRSCVPFGVIVVKWMKWYNAACWWKTSVLDDLGASICPSDGSSMIIWNFSVFVPVYVHTWPHITEDKRQVWRLNCTISQCPDSFSVMYVHVWERDKTVHDWNTNLGHCYCSSNFPWFLYLCMCVCVCVTEK